MRQSGWRKPESPWNRSMLTRKVWSRKNCWPLPKNVELPGSAVLIPLGEGTLRPSINVSLVSVRLRKVCWPNTSGQMGKSPFSLLRLKGSYQCGVT